MMTTPEIKLTDAQLVILSAAGAQPGGAPAEAIHAKVKVANPKRACNSLIKRGLLRHTEIAATDAIGSAPGYALTPEGMAAVGIEGAAPSQEAPQPKPAPRRGSPKKSGDAAPPAKTLGRAPKLTAMLGLLRRDDGVTTKEAAEALDWKEHSVRAFISATIGKKMGLPVTSEKIEDRGRVYRLPPAESAA